MTDILEGKHGVYNLDKREDCYAYLCREAARAALAAWKAMEG